MKIVFVHNNFPAQFVHVAPALVARGHKVWAIGGQTAKALGNIPVFRYGLKRGSTEGIAPFAVRYEADTMRGFAAAQVAAQMAAKGVKPDLIVGHSGWGETVFLREVWPDAKQLLYSEFYTRPHGLDVGFDPEFPQLDLQGAARVRAKYGAMLVAMADADAYVSPTHFQASTYPEMFREKIKIAHDGVDTAWLAPDPAAELPIPGTDVVLRPGDEVVTHVNRHMEPMRGVHIFLRALPAVLNARPNARAVIIGGAGRDAYGVPPPAGTTWKDHYLKELEGKLDLSRVHFFGRVEKPLYRTVLSISAAHAYLTYPFVLSWSLLEAMSAECLVIASDTAPLREVVQDGVNGRLVDFFDVKGWSDRMIEALAEPERFKALRKRAREDVVTRYDLATVELPKWVQMIERMGPGK